MAITDKATGTGPEQVSGCPPFDIGEVFGLRLSFLALLIRGLLSMRVRSHHDAMQKRQ